MQRDPRDEGLRWLGQARRDLDDARYLQEGERWSLTCFHAQQAAEKALKGLLILRGAEDPWGHSVADLAQLAVSLDERWRSWRVDVTGLDLCYIPTRYPDALPGGLQRTHSPEMTPSERWGRLKASWMRWRVPSMKTRAPSISRLKNRCSSSTPMSSRYPARSPTKCLGASNVPILRLGSVGNDWLGAFVAEGV